MPHATIGRMAKAWGIRRFLRFSLRSLLLVTLAVAAWLGYEVHQARTVERQAEALRALGGEVEFEPSPWSLLRFIEPQTYGRRITSVQLTGDRVDEAISVLKGMAPPRTIHVEYDGSIDPGPSWRLLNAALPRTEIAPVSGPFDREPWWGPKQERLPDNVRNEVARESRFAARLSDIAPRFAKFVGGSHGDGYQVVRLRHGRLGEVLVVHEGWAMGIGFLGQTAVLLVDDQYVDSKHTGPYIVISIQDIEGDGWLDLGLETPRYDKRAQALPGDARAWLSAYAIEPDGFRSLLPEDRCESCAAALREFDEAFGKDEADRLIQGSKE
jgi:hypothetical protein